MGDSSSVDDLMLEVCNSEYYDSGFPSADDYLLEMLEDIIIIRKGEFDDSPKMKNALDAIIGRDLDNPVCNLLDSMAKLKEIKGEIYFIGEMETDFLGLQSLLDWAAGRISIGQIAYQEQKHL